MDKTNYKNKNVKQVSIGSIIILLIFTLVFGFLTFISYLALQATKESIFTLFVGVIGLLFIMSLAFTLSSLSGFLKAKSTILKNTHEIKNSNPYIYYRQLPNPYGVGVASLLMDSTLENEKDIVAIILDLCAKGYLNLRKNINGNYTISILKPISDDLLSNEKYVIECIINNKLTEFNYQEWFEYCMEDGVNAGLFTKKDLTNQHTQINNTMEPKIEKIKKAHKIVSLIISIVITIFFLILNITKYELSNIAFQSICVFAIGYIVFYIILYIPLRVIGSIIVGTIVTSQIGASEMYQSQISKYLEPTAKGKEELQKLYSFKAFINDFGLFASKNPEEIVLWDFYLSYAQIFGLTDKILSTGYDKIIKNGSFEIDNLDEISFDKIDINTK